MTEEAFISSSKVVKALEQYPEGKGELSESLFTLFFGRSFFERKIATPETMQRFGQAMSAWSEGDGSGHMRDGYEWGKLGAGMVVDVGGAEGRIAVTIATKFPELTFLVEDQLPLVEQAARLIGAAPRDVRERVKSLLCDFFQPHPEEARGARAYILRYILHDWSNAYSLKILKNVVAAMAPDSRLIIADAVMPPPGVLPRAQEEVLRSFDISMLAQLNAQERTLEMWEALVKEASDGKLSISKVVNPPKGENVSIIECKFSA
jgi:hypothetical protein